MVFGGDACNLGRPGLGIDDGILDARLDRDGDRGRHDDALDARVSTIEFPRG